jgi:hypothetical protein
MWRIVAALNGSGSISRGALYLAPQHRLSLA